MLNAVALGTSWVKVPRSTIKFRVSELEAAISISPELKSAAPVESSVALVGAINFSWPLLPIFNFIFLDL